MNFKNLCIATYVWITTMYGFYSLGFFIKYLKGSISNNLIALGVADVIGYSVFYYLARFKKTKRFYQLACILTSIFSLVF
jgi:hypothetical protein